MKEHYLRFPVFGLNVLSLRRGLAKSQGHVYLEKYTNLPGFRITTLAEKAHRMSTAVKMDK